MEEDMDELLVDDSSIIKCVAPWVNIHVGTKQNVQPCCAGAGIKLTLEQLPEYLSDANQDLTDLKKTLLSQQTPAGCKGCQEFNWYSQFSDVTPNEATEFTLRSLDLRWSNTCQLTCVYCSPSESSAWAALKSRSNTIPIIRHRIPNQNSMFDLIELHRPSLQRISMLGGEPLLIKENVKMLELFPPEIEINIFTGLNVDLDINPLYQKLIKMPNVYWTISMENVGKKFEFVRRNASWDKQVANIDRLLMQNQSRYTVTLQSQFCAYSATSVLELYEFVQDRNIMINWNWLQRPKEINFANFPDRHKLTSLEQLRYIQSRKNDFLCVPQTEHIEKQLEGSLQQGSEAHLTDCLEWHDYQENQYFNNQMDFRTLWPEFCD